MRRRCHPPDAERSGGSHMRLRNKTKRSSGFTLIELVVAAMIAMLVIAGLYVVYAGQARIFRGQEQVSGAQVAARFAMEMVKEDLRRAGSLAVTDTNDPQVIQGLGRPPNVTGGRILAIELEHDQGSVPLEENVVRDDAEARPNEAPDRLTIVGNFTNNERYWVERISGRTVTLQDTSFHDPTDPFPVSETEFNQIFLDDDSTLLRIEHSNKVFFSRIVGRNYDTKTVTIMESPGFMTGLWEGAKVNVVNKVRYAVVDPELVAPNLLTKAERDLAEAGNTALKNRTDLVREIMSWSKNEVIRREIVAENVVDFQVWFLFDAMELPEKGPNVDQRDFNLSDTLTGNAPCDDGLIGTPNCMVKGAHGAVVRLSVRTSREDRNFLIPPSPPVPRRPLQWYEVDPNSEGAARVRTLVSQVALTNIEYLNF